MAEAQAENPENSQEEEEIVEPPPPKKELNPDSAYDDTEEARRAEDIASKFTHKIHPKA